MSEGDRLPKAAHKITLSAIRVIETKDVTPVCLSVYQTHYFVDNDYSE